MDQTYSIWQVNTGQTTSANAGSAVIGAATSGRHLRIVNVRGHGTPVQIIEAVTPTSTTVYGGGTNDMYTQPNSTATVPTEPILLQLPETRQYLVDESSIQNIDQMPPVNLIMGAGGDACDESTSLMAVSDAGAQVFHLAAEPTAEVTIDAYDAASEHGKMLEHPPNDEYREHTQYTEECEVMEEVITDDWVQSQGEECVQVTVDQLGASTIAGTVEDDISVPLDQDEYTLSRPFPCDFCSRRFRKKATLMNHLVAHSNDRPHVCNLCGAQYGRRIDLTNHFKQHAYANNLDETALRSDHEVEYDVPGLPMVHPGSSKQRAALSSEDEDLFNEGTRAVAYNAQPPMQLISSTNSTMTSASAYGSCISGGRLQYDTDAATVVGMNSRILEDGSYPYEAQTDGAARSRSGFARSRAQQHVESPGTSSSQSKRQGARAGGKTATATKGNRRNVAGSSYIKKEPTVGHDEELFGLPSPGLGPAAAPVEHVFPVVDARKPFVCQQCGVSFGREKALASHSRVHGGDMQYLCLTCDERFWDRTLLQDHIRKKHPNVYSLQPPAPPPRVHSKGSKRSTKMHTSSSKINSSFVAAAARPYANDDDEDDDNECLRGRTGGDGSSSGHFICDSCFMVFDGPEHVKKHIQMAHGPVAAAAAAASTGRMIIKQELSEMFFDVPYGEDQDQGQEHGQAQDQEQAIEYMMDGGGNPTKVQQHSATLHGCLECDQTFANSFELLAHNNAVHTRGEEQLECQLCGEKFPNEAIIKGHVQEYHRDELTESSCAICGKLCKNQTSLMKHSYDHSRERAHSCSKCGKTFHHMGRLKRHMASHRNKTVRCEVCDEEFPDGRTLMNHRHSHSKSNNYPCKECGKTFGSRSSQQIHLRIHTGERPYACRFCWKAFADGGTLRKHERVHTGEKPYGCSVCPKEFNQRVVLREHIRAHHSQPDPARGNSEQPYYCLVCSTLFSEAVDLVQHLIEHSDSNTAKKRKPPTFPRKYKRRRKLKPQELERLQSGRRKQKSKPEDDDNDDDDDYDDDGGDGDGHGDHEPEDETHFNEQQQYDERAMSLEREDGTLKTSNELFLEYGDASKAQTTLAVASAKFISPYELILAEGAGTSGKAAGGKDRGRNDDGMLDDIGINLLSNGEVVVHKTTPTDGLLLAAGNNNNNHHGHHTESPGGQRRTAVRAGTSLLASKPLTPSGGNVGGARMIRTEPAKRGSSAAAAAAGGEKSKTPAKRTRKRAANVTTKELPFVPPKEEEGPTGSCVSHAMEAFSELERKRSRSRPLMPSYVREIPSSKISENFPLLDDGNTEDTILEEPHRYGGTGGGRQRYISSTSTASAATTRDEEDEQLLMEIARGEKYTDRFNSDIVNDLAEILRSPVKGNNGGSSGVAATTAVATVASSIPPVDILASPASRYAVILPAVQQKTIHQQPPPLAKRAGSGKTDQQQKRAAASTSRGQAKAKVQSATATSNAKQSSKALANTISSSASSDTSSTMFSHGRRLTRRQLEREVSFLREAYGGATPALSQPSDINDAGGSIASADQPIPAYSAGGEGCTPSAVVKQEHNVSVPEKLAEMLLSDGIPLGTERDSSPEQELEQENYLGVKEEMVDMIESQHDRREQQTKPSGGRESSSLATTTTSTFTATSSTVGYRCSICAAYFPERSQLILHVPVHM